MKLMKHSWLTCLVVTAMAVTGCQESGPSAGGSAPVSEMPPATVDDHAGHDHGDHAHPSEGPHHGDLVELGNEEYHAEVVHNDDAGTVEIYILDGSATKQVAIEATELTINITHDGKPEQFTLTAKPDERDEAGKSSRFFSDDKELAAHLDEEESQPKLVVKIDGKSFRGEISHSHGHADHDHAPAGQKL